MLKQDIKVIDVMGYYLETKVKEFISEGYLVKALNVTRSSDGNLYYQVVLLKEGEFI